MATLEQAINTLNTLLKDHPELESRAAKNIEELTQLLRLPTHDHTSINRNVENLSISGPIEKIRQGFQEFKAYFKKEKELFDKLAESQHPKFMIVGCVDSRADPALTLGLGFGEAFTLRNVANLVHPKHSNNISVAAAMEYAVLHLKVEHLLVIGHSKCGGINALLRLKEDGSNKSSEYIEDWILVAKDAAKKTKNKVHEGSPFDEYWDVCAKESVNASLWNALTHPFVKDAVESGKLGLHGAYFDFVRGSFQFWTFNYNLTEPESF